MPATLAFPVSRFAVTMAPALVFGFNKNVPQCVLSRDGGRFGAGIALTQETGVFWFCTTSADVPLSEPNMKEIQAHLALLYFQTAKLQRPLPAGDCEMNFIRAQVSVLCQSSLFALLSCGQGGRRETVCWGGDEFRQELLAAATRRPDWQRAHW